MERTWKPKAAGILCIIAGAIGVIPGMVSILLLAVMSLGTFHGWGAFVIILIIAGIITSIVVMPIVGGICALRRRRWRLALAGSICCILVGFVILAFCLLFVWIGHVAIWPRTPEFGDTTPLIVGFIVGFVIFGILPIVFVILGKREFE
jgi:hypothetical protein